MKHNDLTGMIIGAAMKVHTHFGQGFPEYVYERALMIELKNLGLVCNQQMEKEITYQNIVIGKRRLDILVDGMVLVELKARKDWFLSSLNQILNYMKIFKIEIGLLFNFSGPSLTYKRFILTQSEESE
ncbi:MAG: GxxExxY protein [Chitinophagaceae bacterium]|nr:GxxExxY protein [Chitinophagaceae bacterium]